MSLRTIRNSLPLWCFTYKEYEYDPADWHEHWRDDFDDGVLDYEWMTHGLSADKTIGEAGGVITIASANNADARWWCTGQNYAPKMWVPLDVLGPCRITTKLNSLDGDPGATCNDDTMAGIFIGTYPEGLGAVGDHYAYLWGRQRDDTGAWDGLRVQRNCGSYDGILDCGGGCLPKWFRISVSATGGITFQYSDDGAAWTDYEPGGSLLTISGYNIGASFVGLFGKNITDGDEEFSAEFEYFLIEVYEARRPEEDECYAPIDVRGPDIFYDGRIQSMASLKRAIDDKTGLFQISDMNLVLKNTDKHFSDLITKRIIKDQEAVLYHAWTDEPEANKNHMITMIVDDFSLKGTDFIVKLKDISQKYFTQEVPEDICTIDDYASISPDHEGRAKPEVLGQANLPTGYEHEGAVEAVYVDTVTGRYIAANRTLRDITQVFLDDVEIFDPAGYTWFVADGDTYIDITGAAPGTDEVLSFNAEGYFRDAWDSDNGYIQNPAYIILFYLRFIMGVPASLIDFASFNTLAAYYESIGEEESFYVVIQDRQDAMEIMRQMLFTAGAKAWINMDGEFTIARKDVDDWEIASPDYHLIEQTDLIGPSNRKWNMQNAINTVNAQFGYIPWQNLYTGARSEYRENPYDRRMEDKIADRDRRRM